MKFSSAFCSEFAFNISRLKSKKGSNLLDEKLHCLHFTWKKHPTNFINSFQAFFLFLLGTWDFHNTSSHPALLSLVCGYK
jgi:hypothetical protein